MVTWASRQPNISRQMQRLPQLVPFLDRLCQSLYDSVSSSNKEMEHTAHLFLLSGYLFCNHDQTEGINPDQNLKCKKPTCQFYHCFLLEWGKWPWLHIPGTWIILVVITLHLIHHQPMNIEYNLIRKCEGPFAGDKCLGKTCPHASPYDGDYEAHTQVCRAQGQTSPV